MAHSHRFSSRIDVGLLGGCVLLSFVAIGLPAQLRDPIAEGFRRTVVAPLIGLQREAERWRTAWLTSEQHMLVRDSVAMHQFNAYALRSENDQLRRILGLGTRLQWGFIPAEALHNPVREDIVSTITLTAGSNAGVRRYSPVVSPDGLVGMVQTADPTMSIAILFSHPDFRASAMSADGTAFGIVYPHQGGTGAERYLLELRGVPFRSTLRTGTPIYTSGLGSSFPRGIPIGTVARELTAAEGWTRTYLLRPAVSPGAIGAVMVLTPQRVAQGVGNAWAQVISSDSATRRIASSGDSLMRHAAVLEAEARRAAIDSVRRATLDSIARVLGAAEGARIDSIVAALQQPSIAPPAQGQPAQQVPQRTVPRAAPPPPPANVGPGAAAPAPVTAPPIQREIFDTVVRRETIRVVRPQSGELRPPPQRPVQP